MPGHPSRSRAARPARLPTRPRALFRAFLVLITAASLGACGESTAPGLRFGLASSPVNLDPRFATDAASGRVNRLLYQALVDFDDAFKPVPGLARWERLDPHHYRFVLREPRAVFSDGQPVRAADVVATYRSVLAEDTASPHRGSLTMIKSITSPDARTIDFELDRPDPLFPGRLVVGVMPAAALEVGRRFNRDPLGSGPFILDGWPDENRVALRRRSDGARVELVRVKDPTVRVLKLLRGEVDLIQGDLPWELRAWVGAREDLSTVHSAGTTIAYLGFNLEDPVVGDERLRRAIAHGIDRAAVIRHLMGGTARQASSLLAPGHWAAAELPGLDHDPVRARALLAEAGFGPGRNAKVTYKTSSDPLRVRLASVLQAQLGRVGVEVDLRTYDWGTFYGDIKAGRFQMYSLAWVGVKMPDIFRFTTHSEAVPPAGANRGRFRDPQVDRLIDRADAATGLEEQAALYRELQALLLERLPYVPLWFEDHVAVMRRGVTGYRLTREGNYDGLIDIVAP